MLYRVLVPLNSVILLTNSMRKWTRDARVGAIALLFAEVLSLEGELEVIDLIEEWGFEKEVEAILRMAGPGDWTTF